MPATLRPVNNGPEFDLKNAYLDPDDPGAMLVPILTDPFGKKRFTEAGLRASVARCDGMLSGPRDRTHHQWDALFRAALERFEALSVSVRPAEDSPPPAVVPPPPPEDPRRPRRRAGRPTPP